MSRKDRSTLIALGMSSAVRDMPTKLRCGLLDEGPDAVEFPCLISWYERRERECNVSDQMARG
jgi:hypothetical protein